MNLASGTACSRESSVCSGFLVGRDGAASTSTAGATSGFLYSTSVAGATSGFLDSTSVAGATSGFLGGRDGDDSTSVAGATSGFLGGRSASLSADAGASIWRRAGFARCVLNFLARLLTGRDAFVTVLAALASVDFGT